GRGALYSSTRLQIPGAIRISKEDALDWLALSAEEWTAIRLSLRVSAVAVVVSLPLGILVALALARGRFWGKSLLIGIVHLPLILPPVVTGFILLILFGRRGPVGSVLDEW